MGSLNYLVDLNEDIMARKVGIHTRYVAGLEAPRNSLELPIETSYRLYAARDNLLYAHHMTKDSAGEDVYSSKAPINKLISEEISKRPNTRSNAPGVVARLMGVDMLPFDSQPRRQLVKIRKEHPIDKMMLEEQSNKGSYRSVGHVLSYSNGSQQPEVGENGHYLDRYPDQFSCGTKLNKYKPREHPQEEELQKFKKEFEAWQAARFSVCSNAVKFSSPPPQLIAQEDLNREKMHLYANSNRTSQCERLSEPNDLEDLVDPHEMRTFGSHKKNNLCYSAEGKDSLYSNTMSRTDCRASQLMNADLKHDIFSAPSKIVILRPGPDSMNINEDSWNNTPSTSGDRGGNIEDFLKEVKERLKSELQGTCSKRSTTVRGGGIETPYREKPSKPREIAQCIAQKARDNVSRDLGMNLLRSESTRSYRSEMQNGTDSPEFINRDSRIFLAERLRNVLRGEMHRGVPRVVRNSSRFSSSDYEKGGPRQSRDTWINNKMSYPDSFTNKLDCRSFRGEPDEGGVPQTDMSPMNLIRSLSAPVSGTSFGKLLLEDRHVLTGAQIRRKHEVIEKVSMNMKKQKKDKFNIREKVSSFRYGLTLRGRLFRRRFKSVKRPDQNQNNISRDVTSDPTVMMSLYETNENFTEVPPSPASVSSSVYDELWRPIDYLSPISSSGGLQLEDGEMSHVFKEINSNLTELRRKLDQLEGAVPDETVNEHQTTEVEAEIEDQSEAYIRDLLIAAGLYDGSFSRSLSKWDPLGRPISAQVFEEVEESFKECTKDIDQGEKVNHRMVLDLLNEVLPALLKDPVNTSRYMEKADGLVHNKPPHGRKLLSLVWNNICFYVHPPADRSLYTLNSILARDLKSNPWSRVMDDDVHALGRDFECQIISDMIEELVEDMHS